MEPSTYRPSTPSHFQASPETLTGGFMEPQLSLPCPNVNPCSGSVASAGKATAGNRKRSVPLQTRLENARREVQKLENRLANEQRLAALAADTAYNELVEKERQVRDRLHRARLNTRRSEQSIASHEEKIAKQRAKIASYQAAIHRDATEFEQVKAQLKRMRTPGEPSRSKTKKSRKHSSGY